MNMGFGAKLKEILTQENISMTELSKRTGITYNMIKKYCSGNADPTVSYAMLIAEELEVSLDTLMSYTPVSKKPAIQKVFEEEFTYISNFVKNVRLRDTKAAVIDTLTNRTYSYADLNSEVNKLSNALLSKNVSRGAVILYRLPDSIEFLSCYLAAQKIGGVNIPLKCSFSEEQISDCLNNYKPEVFICQSKDSIAVKALDMAEWKPQFVLITGEDKIKPEFIRYDSFISNASADEPYEDYSSLIYGESTRLIISAAPDNLHTLSVYNVNEVLAAQNIMSEYSMTSSDIVMSTLTWTEPGCLYSGGPSTTLFFGGTVIIADSSDPDSFLKFAEDYSVTTIIGNPEKLIHLSNTLKDSDRSISSIRRVINISSELIESERTDISENLTSDVFKGYDLDPSLTDRLLLQTECSKKACNK